MNMMNELAKESKTDQGIVREEEGFGLWKQLSAIILAITIGYPVSVTNNINYELPVIAQTSATANN